MLSKSVLVVLTLFASCCLASKVLDLGDSDFESTLAKLDAALVMFYAPWCGHCKNLKPEYVKAAPLLGKAEPPVTLVQVDCTEAGKETCQKFKVNGYPTLKIFIKGEWSADYKGPRDAAGIVKYMKAQTGPASRELKSLAELEKYLSAQEATILGLFAKDSPLKSVFLKFADKQREKFRFGHSSAADALKKYGETDAILLIRAPQLANIFEESTLKFRGSKDAELETFVKQQLHGLVGHRTGDNAQDFEAPYIVAYFAVDYTKDPKGTNYWRNRILKLAKAYKGAYRFAISSKDEFQKELQEFGQEYSGKKPVVLARDEQKRKHVMKEDFSIANLEKFLKDLEDGKLEPYLKTQEIPTDNNGPVTVAVAKNFDEVVLNNGMDTLIEFYAPWCGHCKKLAPTLDELGNLLLKEDVEIVSFDASSNDVPEGFNVRGFPTLFWLPKDSKSKPQSYTGGRDLQDFIKFIAQRATKELKSFDRDGNPKEKSEEIVDEDKIEL